MDKNSAKKLIKDTLENPFDKSKFTPFIKNLLNHIEETPQTNYYGNLVPDAYKPYINSLNRIGKYTDPDGKKLDVLVINLKKETSLERARSMQRNFIAWYLNGSRGDVLKDAALVAFVSPDQEDWRFSLVKMQYRFDTTGETPKVKQEFTPARRYSFLVGANENSHTAQSQLFPILCNEAHDPALAELEDAFSIEKVTKEFFGKYRELYLNLKEALEHIVEGDPKIKTDFTQKGIDTVDFVKKLLGQIVFLYFLQKKGWFGVGRDEDWGTGPKDFLRRLFEKKHGDYKNFFNNILEPLFYNTLALERTFDYSDRFDCKIPFLNGGLFDPLNNYDWVHTDIIIPDKLFSNQEPTKEGDTGNGILDVFDRYNFTVKEDEPLEKEVAVDPEMLGKVFENLLEVKDRKSKGTYYTPREIVHYMCQESLINYLATELPGKASKDDLELLIKYGETAVEHDTHVEIKGKETDRYSYKLSESIRQHAKAIDGKLVQIRVCDPAIGSGAFPVGMMNEIVRARNVLTAYLPNEAERTIYHFKRHAIQECIYGVDIDPGAVEIAKLRLWLSLVVDEEDIKQIKPLPNLDYKIMQGNSLLEEYEGIKLIDEQFFKKQDIFDTSINELKIQCYELNKELTTLHNNGQLTSEKQTQIEKKIKAGEKQIKKLQEQKQTKPLMGNLFDLNLVQQKADQLLVLHRQFFETFQKTQKDNLKERIEKVSWELIEATLKEQGKEDNLPELARFKKTNTQPFFLWHLHFAEVFQEKGGFDVVIANPPYLRIQEIQKNAPDLAEQLKKVYFSAFGSYDIYVCFVELATKQINNCGNVAYILPHKFFQASFGKNLRKLLSSKNYLRKIIDFGSSQVFETATTYTCLLFLSLENDSFKFVELKPTAKISDLEYVFNTVSRYDNLESEKVDIAIISNNTVTENEWQFIAGKAGKVLAKIKKQPRTLSNVCDKIFVGLQTSADKIYFLEHLSENDGLVTAFSKSLNREIPIERKIVKPLLKGADVHRYAKLQPKIWCIFPYALRDNKAVLYTQKEIKTQFPLAWKYLLENRKELENRERGRMANDQFYAYIYPKNLTKFDRPKIITPEISYGCNLTYDPEGLYHNTKCYSFVFKKLVTEPPLFYLSILNSRLLWFFLTTTGYVLRGGYFVFKTNYLMPFPLPKELSEHEQKPFINLVDKILALTKTDDYLQNVTKQAKVKEYEQQIDQMVYKLYDLTPEEIAIVEGARKNNS